MNREIKFRIWNRDAEQWYEPVFEAYKGLLFELLLTTSGELCERSMQGFTHESRFPGKYVIQQYTGLKDKNGKEIYEGDIVSIFGGLDKYFWHPVKCHLGEFGYWIDDGHFIGFGGNHFFEWTEQGQSDHIEVLGNLFDNPELLNKEQGVHECDATKAT